MLEKFLERTEFSSYEDFKANYKVKTPENFNFAFDIVDGWAEEKGDIELTFFSSNYEGAMAERLYSARKEFDGIVLNAGAWSHYSVGLRDAIVAAGIPVVEVDRAKLDGMAGMSQHQGVIAMAAEKEYCSVEDIIEIARSRGEAPLIVISDGITDPYNLGSLIRCAEGVGAHGLIIPKRRASGLTPLVSKSSAGAIEHLAVAKVSNIAQTIEELKEQNIWVYAAEAGGQAYYDVDFTGGCAIVFGSEGEGVSQLVKQRSDVIVSIPMYGQVNSFNVSTAAAVILAEASKQHRQKK